MHTDLSHLSDDEMSKLIQRYYNDEAAKKLIAEYDLNIKPSNLYKLFPPEEFTNYDCEYCENVLVADRPSKAMAKMPRYESALYCPCCGHKPYTKCDCDACKQAQIQQKEDRIKNINKSFGTGSEQVEFESLPFVEKVYLGALCRAYLRENLFEIAPISEKNVILAPSDDFCSEIYNDLIRAEAIKVSPLSPINAFIFDENNWPEEYYTYQVTYNLNLVFPPNKNDLFAEILNPSYYSHEHQENVLHLWKKIALAECIEYLQYSLKKVGFEFSPGDKTYTTFGILLNDFSTSQIYGIIWKAVADASKLYLEKGMSKQHAANTVIGACERYAERAKINNWELTKYKRVKDLPQSILSLFLFNRVLGIGEKGFDNPPCIV